MKKNIVHILCILDASGSMASIRANVIQQFNSFLEEQKKVDAEAILTLVYFSNKTRIMYDQIDLRKAEPLNEKTYTTGGGTAMYDAIGISLSDYAHYKNAIVLIQTDGQENSSRIYNQSKVFDMVKEKEKMGWDFLFLGANIDTGAEGSKMGLRNKSVSFQANNLGIQNSYADMGYKTTHYRRMKAKDDDYKPVTDEELAEQSKGKGPAVKWDKKTNSYVLA